LVGGEYDITIFGGGGGGGGGGVRGSGGSSTCADGTDGAADTHSESDLITICLAMIVEGGMNKNEPGDIQCFPVDGLLAQWRSEHTPAAVRGRDGSGDANEPRLVHTTATLRPSTAGEKVISAWIEGASGELRCAAAPVHVVVEVNTTTAVGSASKPLAGNSSTNGYGCPEPDAVTGAAGEPLIIFTHMRRTGGTVLENQVLKPLAERRAAAQTLEATEGGLALFARMSRCQRARFGNDLARSALVWRHVPYGVHELLGGRKPYMYITVLRDPSRRMLSWYVE